MVFEEVVFLSCVFVVERVVDLVGEEKGREKEEREKGETKRKQKEKINTSRGTHIIIELTTFK